MDNLKEYLIKKGATLIGYANLSDLPDDVRNHYDFGIAIGVALNPAVIKTIKNGPNLLYEREYIRVNQLLDSLGKSAVDYVQKKGYQAQAISSTISTDLNDLVDLSTLLPHKTVATRAGLGWIGKSALLITREYGSAIRLTTVLTDMKLVTGEPVEISYCGKCQNCVQVCPGQAILGKEWHKGLKRDQIYDAFKCRDAIIKMIGPLRITHFICGQCIAACPWTQKR